MDSDSDSVSIRTVSTASFFTNDDESVTGSDVILNTSRSQILNIELQEGDDMTLLDGTHWQEQAETPLKFLLNQLNMSTNEKEWRCIAGSYALRCFETDVLGRRCDWRSGDVDVFHVCTYAEFLWYSFYPFLARLWNWGFHIVLHTVVNSPNGERVSPLTLMSYITRGITDEDDYGHVAVDALFDVDISTITDEVDYLSFLLNSNLSDTLEVVDDFDIDICQLRMIWPSGDEQQYAIYAPTSISNNIMMRQMTVTYRVTQCEYRTRKRKEKYESRGYKTVAVVST